MADSAKSRRSNIAEKRKRLAALRARKAARRKPKVAAAVQTDHAKPVPTATTPLAAPAAPAAPSNLDSIIEGLLSSSTPGVAPPEPPAPILPTSIAGGTDTSCPFALQQEKAQGPVVSLEERLNALTLSNAISELHISPQLAVCYSKGSQTDEWPDSLKSIGGPLSPRTPRTSISSLAFFPEPSPAKPEDFLLGAAAASNSTKTAPDAPAPATLTSEEVSRTLVTQEFQNFFNRSSSVVERALGFNEEFDLTVEYGQVAMDEKDADAEEILSVQFQLADERWSKDRTVTDLHWSMHYKELLLASYNARSTDSDNWSHYCDPDGVLLVWSMHRRKSPEFVFTCQSPILTAKFHRFSPSLIVGASYSGQVLLWDKRAKSEPVQRTPLSTQGHTHPVHALSIVGTANAHSLVTVSSDGKLCKWDTATLQRPTDSMQLSYKKAAGMERDVAVMAMAYADGEPNAVYVGGESGKLYHTFTDDRKNSGNGGGLTQYPPDVRRAPKSEGNYSDASGNSTHGNPTRRRCIGGHFGPVTGMQFHPATATGLSRVYDAQQLLLTSSVDWTCKLWDLKRSPAPLCEFQTANDYVLDARWSPVHPAMFAAADGEGFLQLWNLNADLEAPIVRKAATAKPKQSHALNRLRWSHDGQRIAAGDSSGAITVFGLQASAATPRADEAARLAATLARLSKLTTSDRAPLA